jgi:hypothetical protein
MPKPILQSLILADHVYEDKLTGKRIIAGIFNRIIRGVRVVREVTPPTPAPAPPQVQPSQPIQVQPPQPVQPSAPIQVHHGQSVPPSPPPASDPVPPSHPAPASQPAPAAESHAPAAPQAPVGQAMTPSASSPASPPAHVPAVPPQPSAHQPSVPPPSLPPAAPTPPTPHTPPSPPLQPGQRVLEIPPTGLQSGSPFAYLSLTEVRGRTPLMLQLVNLQDDSQLFRSELLVECHNPLYTIEMTVPLPPIAPPQAGIYALELIYNNELLGSLRIVVEDAAQQ